MVIRFPKLPHLCIASNTDTHKYRNTDLHKSVNISTYKYGNKRKRIPVNTEKHRLQVKMALIFVRGSYDNERVHNK